MFGNTQDLQVAPDTALNTTSEARVLLFNAIVNLNFNVDAFVLDDNDNNYRIMQNLGVGRLHRYDIPCNRERSIAYTMTVVPESSLFSIFDLYDAVSVVDAGGIIIAPEAGRTYYGMLTGWYSRKDQYVGLPGVPADELPVNPERAAATVLSEEIDLAPSPSNGLGVHLVTFPDGLQTGVVPDPTLDDT